MTYFMLYNSLSRQKEIFEPAKPHQGVQMYVCGPTVYDFAHLGNARAMVVFDVLHRLLRRRYGKVTFVRNITDIDDKIYAASREQQTTCSEIAHRFEQAFLEDMQALSILPPTYSPHATEFIPQIIQMIATLLEKGAAYESGGHVLFSVDAFPGYGQLARKTRNELVAGARVDVADYKHHPEDFVLWKPSEGDWPGWESPWGRGRPGWHIECSAMSSHYFGSSFDIHGGGIDLIFPHHENERAQSACAHGTQEMARFWLHNGHLMVQGKKMSKSLGNFLTVRSLLQQTHPEVIRYALLSAHYRQPLDWTNELIPMAQQMVFKWYRALAEMPEPFWEEDFTEREATPSEDMAPLITSFEEALLDDMNTPLALQKLNKMVQHCAKTKEDLVPLVRCGRLLGLLTQEPKTLLPAGTAPIDKAKVEALIKKRQQAKAKKDFQQADAIRDELARQGIILEDSPQGTTWRPRPD